MKIRLRNQTYVTAREVAEHKGISLGSAMKMVKGHPLHVEFVNPRQPNGAPIRVVPALAVDMPS